MWLSNQKAAENIFFRFYPDHTVQIEHLEVAKKFQLLSGRNEWKIHTFFKRRSPVYNESESGKSYITTLQIFTFTEEPLNMQKKHTSVEELMRGKTVSRNWEALLLQVNVNGANSLHSNRTWFAEINEESA